MKSADASLQASQLAQVSQTIGTLASSQFLEARLMSEAALSQSLRTFESNVMHQKPLAEPDFAAALVEPVASDPSASTVPEAIKA
jgi:hypothetical protein